MASDAVGSERVSAVVGYKLTKGQFQEVAPNLPQSIAVLGEANEGNQGTLDTTPTIHRTAESVGAAYGYGSPLHMAARVLFPKSGGGIGGIPVTFYPQAEAASADEKILELNVSGTATATATHTLKIAGRDGLDGDSYSFVVSKDDTVSDITAKIENTVNAVLGCPMLADDSTYSVILTSKWKGLTAEDLSIEVDTAGNAAGITYTVEDVQTAAGTPSLSTALAAFGNTWHTLVVNTYGTVTSVMDSLESTNGIPDPSLPTGRFAGIVFKPFIALTGSTADDPSDVTDPRQDDVTIAICPAPNSQGLPLEAAANMCVLFARTSQDNPHLDVYGATYPDMPVPSDLDIGSMSSYDNRDAFVKKGCSTVDLNVNKYRVIDFVTTYHPVGENPPQYRYCRNLMLDFNVYYSYYLLEQTYLVGATIASNDDTVSVSGVIKPKIWQGIIDQLADQLANRALIAEASFMQDSLLVDISATNPDRLETFFRYKRTGVARISSTTAEAGFNFGS